MVAAVVTTLHSAAAGERAHRDGEAREKREAQQGLLQCGAGSGRVHGLFSLGVGFANLGRVSGKDLTFRDPRLRYWSRWESFGAGKLLIALRP